MRWLTAIKGFVLSYHFSNGLRTTISVVVPSLVGLGMGQLIVGIAISTGALCSALSDQPGTFIHKRNGAFISIALIFITALFTGLAAHHPFIMAPWVTLCCFVFSMLLVYGNRGGNIGIACLLVMIIILGDPPAGPREALTNAGWVLVGGLWHGLLSLVLWQIRPYLNVQQVLGECIQETARYLELRAGFYVKDADINATYKAVLEQQVVVNEKQEAVRELLLKRRSAQQGTSTISKSMVLIFLDLVDLQEQIMASQIDYNALHQHFGAHNILEVLHGLLLDYAQELKDIGLAVMAGQRSMPKANLRHDIEKVQEAITAIRKTMPTLRERTRLITLTGIVTNLHEMADRIYNLHRLTRLERLKDTTIDPRLELSRFTTSNRYDIETFRNNLTFQSHIFRHAIRVSLATTTGYLLGVILHLDRVYWILLTIVVILKPGFGLTKSRSYQRIMGTIIGALFAILVLLFVKNPTAIFIIMLVCILGSYTFTTYQYTISVIFTTPFVIFLLHFLRPADLQYASARVLDTLIGGTLAFIANLTLWPSWEHRFLPSYMEKMIRANKQYFEQVIKLYTGQQMTITEYKLARKETYVATANLMGAFQRMLSEPKNQQKNISRLYHFVVLNHTLTSRIAALAAYGLGQGVHFPRPEYQLIEKYLQQYMNQVVQLTLQPGAALPELPGNLEAFETLDILIESLIQQRQTEINQGKGETPVRNEMLETKQVRDQLHGILVILKDMKKAMS
ncbi:MAG TPA: FUSC family membrane protein [Chitinophaga sp.]|uniref:FUSC family protein n=1 Tax=Chitinophaga sp. TaxID=1869181 RepID=UPI002DBEE646|nr:FUSC family membrane protein [Chitinophaga sp.]HEU4553494.1 FUSC family membrane protein [Chitinophaga sp.]